MAVNARIPVLCLLPTLALLTTPAPSLGQSMERGPALWYCYTHSQGTTCLAAFQHCTLSEAAWHCANDPELILHGIPVAAYCDAGNVQCDYDS